MKATPQHRRFAASSNLYELSRNHLAGSVSSGMRSTYKPLSLNATGSHIRDVDGHEYINACEM